MWPNPQETADWVTFAGDIFNGTTWFFGAVNVNNSVILNNTVLTLNLNI